MLAFQTKSELVSTWQPFYWYKKFPRKYAVELETITSPDPFDCWRATWRSAKRSLGSLHPAARLPLLPSRVSCCYVSAEFRPKCFGVVQQTKLSDSEPQTYVWYHPNNCCGSQRLHTTLQKYTRCTQPRQKVWRVAVAQALLDGSRHCRPETRRAIRRGSLFGRHLNLLSRAPACPAAAALLQVSCKITRRGIGGIPKQADQAFSLRDVGRHDKHCSIYGHDSAACCLVQVCKTDLSGLRCLACLLAEVPWGFWSRSQRLLLSRLLHSVSARPVSNLPHLRDAFRQLLDADQDVSAKEPAGVGAPQLMSLLMIISTVLSLSGRHHLYSALHALQVAAPLHLLQPEDLGRILHVLAQRPMRSTNSARPGDPAPQVSQGRREEAPEAAPLCGSAVATFITFHRASSISCPARGWAALARAASEGGNLARWPTAALALCLLSEAAEFVDADEVLLLDRMVDRYLSCLGSGSCPWHEGTCGHELWTPVLRRIRSPTPASPTVAPPASASLVKNHMETMQHLLAGGSLMRFNDGEQLQLNSEVNGPLARYTDTLIRLGFSVQAQCPGLCVGIIDPNDMSTLAALGQTHLEWWQEAGLPNTRALFESGLLPDQSPSAARAARALFECCKRLKESLSSLMPQDIASGWCPGPSCKSSKAS